MSSANHLVPLLLSSRCETPSNVQDDQEPPQEASQRPNKTQVQECKIMSSGTKTKKHHDKDLGARSWLERKESVSIMGALITTKKLV